MNEVGVTVKELLKACEEQVKKGNGDKIVLISNDDEGNGFHTLFYQFTDKLENIKGYSDCFHDNNNPENVVLLG